MTLHLVRLPVDLAALARTAGDRGWTRGRSAAFDEGAALHHLLGETFGPAALQPFRLMVAPRAPLGTLYAYTEAVPAALRELAAATATPEVVTAVSPERLESKSMPADWSRGRRLGFDVRLRPTVRLASGIPAPEDRSGGRIHGFRQGAEVDAFLAEALRHEGRDEMADQGRTREAVYRDWLGTRLGEGAALESARLTSFRRTVTLRGGKTREGPDIVVHGTIRIDDPDAFAALLRDGVGRHKAFGFGMLLLRPPAASEA